MDIGQLKHFTKLAMLEHLTKAAEELFISQSTLSVSISRLENELGVNLFDRVGRNIRLNRFGEAFLSEVDTALAHIKKGTSILKSMQHNEQNSVRIITPTLLGFPDLISDIERVCRNVSILTSNCPLDLIVPKLVSGDADFCIISMDLQDPILDGCDLREQEMGFVVAASHPLASRGTVAVGELINENFAAFPPGTGQRHVLSALFENNGLSPKVVFECDSFYEIMRAVSRGNCIAAVVKAVYQNYNVGNTVFLDVSDPTIDVILRLYWIKAQKGGKERPLAITVREVIRQYFARLQSMKAENAAS